MEPIRMIPTCPGVSLPRPELAIGSNARIAVHCVVEPLTVRDAAGQRVAALEPGESAEFEAVRPRFLWWDLRPRWVRVR